jgi:polyhydroxyalkanoate synthesis repressor PhaR
MIKKYPNRRLYDTELSRYVTLADVRELVMQGQEMRVIDTANSENITRSILLQIMLEEESSGEPLFSAKMLCQLIRFYGGSVQGIFARYLEKPGSLRSAATAGAGGPRRGPLRGHDPPGPAQHPDVDRHAADLDACRRLWGGRAERRRKNPLIFCAPHKNALTGYRSSAMLQRNNVALHKPRRHCNDKPEREHRDDE